MKILKTGQDLRLVSNDVKIMDKLPIGIYSLGYNDMMGEYILNEQNFDTFKVPDKMYGNADIIVDRVKETYLRRGSKLGVLLHGEKGTGKSLIGKKLLNQLNIPVIMIKTFFKDSPKLETFLNELNTPVAIFIDEFEKIYDHPQKQTTLLSIMDGTGQSDILFILTCNEDHNISPFFRNRPGRVYYNIKFRGLDESTCKTVIDDLLIKPDKRGIIEKAMLIIGTINFDLLVAMIEEVNNNDIDNVNDLMYYLNVEPSGSRFEVTIKCKGKPTIGMDYVTNENPLVVGTRVDNRLRDLRTYKVLTEEECERLELDPYVDEFYYPHDYENLKVDNSDIKYEVGEYIVSAKRIEVRNLVY